MIGSFISLEEFGRSDGFDTTLLLELSFEQMERCLGTRNPSADEHLLADEDGLAVAHLQLGGHGDVSVREEAVGHGAVQQGGDHPAVETAFKAFESSMAVKRGADAAVIVDGEFQPQAEGVGLAAHDTVGMGLGPDGFEPGLAGSSWRCHIRVACGRSFEPPGSKAGASSEKANRPSEYRGIMRRKGWWGVAICNTRGDSRLGLAAAQPRA